MSRGKMRRVPPNRDVSRFIVLKKSQTGNIRFGGDLARLAHFRTVRRRICPACPSSSHYETEPIWSNQHHNHDCQQALVLPLLGQYTIELFQKRFDFALLAALGFRPIAHQFLFGTHVLDQTLDTLGKVRHSLGSRPARSAFLDNARETVDRRTQVIGGAGGLCRCTQSAIFIKKLRPGGFEYDPSVVRS